MLHSQIYIIRKAVITIFRLLLVLVVPSSLTAQSFAGLNHLSGHKTDIYYSKGAGVQAERSAVLCDNVISFYNEHLDFTPKVTLLVLSPDDWSTYTNFPVYGMPHYDDKSTLIVASEDNAFWQSFLPPLEQLSPDLADQIRKTYTDQDGNLSMRPFFDLLSIHEL